MKNLGPLTQQLAPTVQATNRTKWPFQLRSTACACRRSEKLELRGEVKEIAITNLGLPADAIADPFNGKLLQLKKLPTGWMRSTPRASRRKPATCTKTVGLATQAATAPLQVQPDISDSESP